MGFWASYRSNSKLKKRVIVFICYTLFLNWEWSSIETLKPFVNLKDSNKIDRLVLFPFPISHLYCKNHFKSVIKKQLKFWVVSWDKTAFLLLVVKHLLTLYTNILRQMTSTKPFNFTRLSPEVVKIIKATLSGSSSGSLWEKFSQ